MVVVAHRSRSVAFLFLKLSPAFLPSLACCLSVSVACFPRVMLVWQCVLRIARGSNTQRL